VESAQGQRNFAEEQEKLVRRGYTSLETCIENRPVSLGGNMLIDILITTPGRLAEHILHTPGFTLQHLQYLVLDEADRLLHQSFQNWTELAMKEISTPKVLQTEVDIKALLESTDELPIIGQRHVDALFGDSVRSVRKDVRKLIFSATLSYDVGKLTALGIKDPEIVSVQAGKVEQTGEEKGDDAVFSVPTTLREYAVSVTDDKPLCLLYLLDKYRLQEHTLIFTHSTETATRLNHFFTQFYKSRESEVSTEVISSEVPLQRRKKLLTAFTSGRLNMYPPPCYYTTDHRIITTDLLSRGMDIKGIQHVISYDSPPTSRIYIHRAGRTARAGRDGDVWTLVADKEARWYWKSVVGVIKRSSKVERVKVVESEIPTEVKAIYHSIVEV